MKKSMINIILVLLMFLMPISIKAVSVKETIIESNDEVIINEKFESKVKISFSELDKNSKDGNGIALVFYELIFDDNVITIDDVTSDDWNTRIYRDKDNKYYALSELSKSVGDNKCLNDNLYCGDYEVTYSLYAKINDVKETEIKIGDVIVGVLPITNSKKELTIEDVVLINVSGKSNKVLKIKDSDKTEIEKKEIEKKEDIVIQKDKVEITKEMVLESKNNTYSLSEKDNYLDNIEIDGYDIKFKKYTNDYSLVVKENIKTLNIKVTLSNKDATYEILGNDNLVDGSIIKIEVKAKNDEINTYNIKINKEKVEKETQEETKKEVKTEFLGIHIDSNNLDYKIIGMIVGGIIGLFFLIKIILKLRDRKLEKAIKKL